MNPVSVTETASVLRPMTRERGPPDERRPDPPIRPYDAHTIHRQCYAAYYRGGHWPKRRTANQGELWATTNRTPIDRSCRVHLSLSLHPHISPMSFVFSLTTHPQIYIISYTSSPPLSNTNQRRRRPHILVVSTPPPFPPPATNNFLPPLLFLSCLSLFTPISEDRARRNEE